MVGLRAAHTRFFLLCFLRHSPDTLSADSANHAFQPSRHLARPSEYATPLALVLAHTYDFPLVYTPVAPSGLHQAPGYTETPTDAGEVAVVFGTVAVGDVAVVFGTVAEGDVAVGEVAVGDVRIVPISGASDHGAITNPAHDELSRFLIRPHSL